MNKVQDEINGLTLANQIRLERAVHSGSFLLVEGSDDAKLFNKFCDDTECSIIICTGRDKLLEALTILEEEGFAGALGFADKDFNEFVGCPPYNGTVVFTDENDIEIMILCSSALGNVLHEYGVKNKITSTVSSEGKQIFELIFEAASFIGALRMMSQLKSWNLSFNGMKYRFLKQSTYFLDEKKSVHHILVRSDKSSQLSELDIINQVRDQVAANAHPKALCCGHDCLRILGRALHRKFGSTNEFNNDNGAKDLGRILRLAYGFDFFRETNAYKEIRKWETNSGFKVLQ